MIFIISVILQIKHLKELCKYHTLCVFNYNKGIAVSLK